MIYALDGVTPELGQDVFVADTAVVIGNVVLGDQASVWFGAVIRGDSGRIAVGARTSVQDNVVLHVNEYDDTIIGADVTIGHGAVLEGCQIGDGTLIGMNATVLSGAVIGPECVIAAGAVVREGMVVPMGTLVAGVPAKVKGMVSAEMHQRLKTAPKHYVENARRYRYQLVQCR